VTINVKHGKSPEPTPPTPKAASEPYKVGYGKPPKHSQFKPGVSGNTKGRPKKVPTVAEIIQKELSLVVTVTLDGQPMKLTQGALVVKSLTRQAMNGNIASAKTLLGIWQLMKEEPTMAAAVSADEIKLLLEILKPDGVG